MPYIQSSMVAAQMLINAIQNKEREFSLNKICMDIKSIMKWDFNFKAFMDTVYEFPDIEIELLWKLHVLQVLPFDVSLIKFASKASSNLENICKLFLTDNTEDEASEFVQFGLICYLTKKAFSGNGEEIEKVCFSIMQSFLRELFLLKPEDMTDGKMKTFFSLWKCGLIEDKSLLEFCVYTVHQFLKHPNAVMMEAFLIQECCNSHSEPFHMTFVMEKVIQNLKSDDLVSILFEYNAENTINWKNYLVILEAFIRTHDDECKIILRNNEELVKRSFQLLDQSVLKKAIIIGRQIAMHSKEPFPTAYNQWFLNQFGNSLYIKNPQYVSFFVQVLCQFVPYERNVAIMKVSLERPLIISSEFQSIYNDYIVLLKTRIKDLEPQVQPEDVISKLLSVYQDTGKVPSYVMEASLMQKQYFLNGFLRALLKPRVIPAFPDVRERFIEELHRIGKIPGAIFQKYRIACDQEKQKLLAGTGVNCIIIDEDN